MIDEAVEESAIAARRTKAALVLLEYDDIHAGVALLQLPGGPQAGEAATHDRDVGGGVGGEGRGRLADEFIVAECFAQPPAGLGDRGHDLTLGVALGMARPRAGVVPLA